MPAERFSQVYMLVHARGEPMALRPQMREVATAVNPTLRLSDVQRVDKVLDAGMVPTRRTLGVEPTIALRMDLGLYAVRLFRVRRALGVLREVEGERTD